MSEPRFLLIASAGAGSVENGSLRRLWRSIEAGRAAASTVMILALRGVSPSALELPEWVDAIEVDKHCGLARARNLALAFAGAHGLPADDDVVAFPDDDCWYPSGLLERVTDAFGAGTDFVFGCYGPSAGAIDRRRWGLESMSADTGTVLRMMSSVTMFFRGYAVKALGDFDERFGVGGRFEAAEEAEYGLRALGRGFTAAYVPQIVVGHEYKAGNQQRYVPGGVAAIALHAGDTPGATLALIRSFRWIGREVRAGRLPWTVPARSVRAMLSVLLTRGRHAVAATTPMPVRNFVGRWRRRELRAEEIRRLTYAKRRDRQLVDALRRGLVASGSHDVTVTALGGHTIQLRAGTSDAQVAHATFVGAYHLPPPEAGDQPRVIYDLGANIGLTLAHYAHLFPDARVVGVELDPGNAELARGAVFPWASRCVVIDGAVWTSDGTIEYMLEPGDEHGAHVLGDGEVAVNRNGRGPVRRRAAAHSLNSLLENERAVDFVKMDIEGAERDVLRTSTEWSSKVRSMKIEVHEPYTVDQCAQDLRRLGFRTRPDGRHWASVVAFR